MWWWKNQEFILEVGRRYLRDSMTLANLLFSIPFSCDCPFCILHDKLQNFTGFEKYIFYFLFFWSRFFSSSMAHTQRCSHFQCLPAPFYTSDLQSSYLTSRDNKDLSRVDNLSESNELHCHSFISSSSIFLTSITDIRCLPVFSESSRLKFFIQL